MPIKQKVFSIKHNKNFRNIEGKILMQVQEAYRTPIREEQKNKSPISFYNKLQIQKTSTLKTVIEKVQVTYQGRLIRKTI